MKASYPGPLIIGAAVWCAAGLVTVESAGSAVTRLAAPAPWWVFAVGVVAGCLVPAFRRSPLAALPALVSTLAWWPVPMPAVALLWTGPLGWFPILVAVAVAEGSRRLGGLARVTQAHAPGRATVLAGLLTVLMGGATLLSLSPRLPGGDEPHYLVITQSLLRDGDLRIENNHTRRDYAEYFSGTLRPDYINRGRSGEIYSIHAPGVSVLVLPAFAAFGLRGAQLTILMCLALTAMVVWRLSWRATGDVAAAGFAWASVTGAVTNLLLGVMVFPDSPAALGSAAAVWLLVALARPGAPVRRRHILAVSIVLAALPWLHTRFAVVAAALGVAILGALWVERGLDARARLRRLVAFTSVPALSAMGWLWSFHLMYGTLDPRAPYRGAESIRDWVWGAVAGLFGDQQFGLLTFAPVLLAAFIGMWRTSERSLRFACLASALTLAAYTVAVASYHMWWAGLPGLPARFLTAVLPLFALPLAIGWARATSAGRAVLLAMLSVSWTISALVIAVDHGAFAFNFRDGQAAWLEWLNSVVNLPRAWPSFFWRTQGAFLMHFVVLLGAWVAGWLLLRTYVRRHAERADIGRLAVAAWILFGLMAGSELGWRRNGVSGLDPARSQLAVHAAGAAWRVGAFTVQQVESAPLLIRADEAPLSDRPTAVLLSVGPVPAGEYEVSFEGGVPRAFTLQARIGRSREPLETWPVVTGSPGPLRLSLPAGAGALVLEAESPAAAVGVVPVLRPSGAARPGLAVARSSVSRAEARVFFLDDQVFVEPEGFWIRGGRVATVVWSSGDAAAGRTRTVTLRNGGAANQVTVRVDGWAEVVTLEAWQERVVTLPAADATGAWRVSIHSASGFRPSELSGGNDDRFLGVWVVF